MYSCTVQCSHSMYVSACPRPLTYLYLWSRTCCQSKSAVLINLNLVARKCEAFFGGERGGVSSSFAISDTHVL